MAGTLLAATGQRVLLAHPPGGAARWERPNHRGSRVSLLSGPTLVAMAALTSGLPALPAAVAALGAAGIGLYDDAAGHRDRAKGLRGHAAALWAGRVTGGVVKVLGIGASSLTAVLLLPRRSAVAVVRDAALVAGTANLLNLLDLRPGRASRCCPPTWGSARCSGTAEPTGWVPCWGSPPSSAWRPAPVRCCWQPSRC